MKRLWPELVALVGKQLSLFAHEARNKIRHDRRFEEIDDIDRIVLRDLWLDTRKIFGENGTPAPVPHMEQYLNDYERSLILWLSRYNIGEPEAATMVHDFLNEC